MTYTSSTSPRHHPHCRSLGTFDHQICTRSKLTACNFGIFGKCLCALWVEKVPNRDAAQILDNIWNIGAHGKRNNATAAAFHPPPTFHNQQEGQFPMSVLVPQFGGSVNVHNVMWIPGCMCPPARYYVKACVHCKLNLMQSRACLFQCGHVDDAAFIWSFAAEFLAVAFPTALVVGK